VTGAGYPVPVVLSDYVSLIKGIIMHYSIRIFIVLLSALILASCNLDSQFLRPTSISLEAKGITFITRTGSTTINFSGENKQPSIQSDIYTIESVFFQSTSGNNLNGWLITPTKGKPSTTLLHFHGNAGSLPTQYELMTPLVEQGFQVFMFDYSGFGFSSGKATRKNVLKDGLSALDYIMARKDVKNTKLVIYGQSYGGHLAYIVGSKRQGDIDGIVTEGAFSSPKDISAEVAGILGRIFVREPHCAYKAVRDIHKPVLIIHSTEDSIIPFKMGQKLYDNANQPKEFMEILNSHLYGPTYYTDAIATSIEKMLK